MSFPRSSSLSPSPLGGGAAFATPATGEEATLGEGTSPDAMLSTKALMKPSSMTADDQTTELTPEGSPSC
eukprot:CAMPEP_0180555548 /NCGR_PEP_ID=MMETSP1037_2-20121125/23_1 /TAXON_ID=632150 /ORGANISM="Azadinium spinosum, Strain 3D9" /LENGTH=69 /DNA_ID=CAMNT_0022571363 /DNA_START=425 /DNA_END=634 /DNA_ORIENTATION=-